METDPDSWKIHVLQHVDFENPGLITDWASERGYALSETHLYRGDVLPAPDDFDLLVVMGGPMGLADTEKYPWLQTEKTFLKNCIAAGKKILGICLGAQLLAEALGAGVYPNKQKEIGWFPIQKEAFSHHPVLALFPENTLPAFHWHGDTFNLPRQAVPLFSSEATRNQAFVWDDRVFALQFHWEVKQENIRLLLKNAVTDVENPGPFVQTPEEMLAGTSFFPDVRKYLFLLLDFIAG